MLLNKIEKLKYFLFIPIVCYSLLIIYLSNLESVPYVIKQFEVKDKFLHFFGFMAFSIFVFIPLIFNNITLFTSKLKNTYKDFNLSTKYAFIFSILFAISDEIHQGFVVGRDADIFDLLADILGIIAGIYLIKIIILKLLKIENNLNK